MKRILFIANNNIGNGLSGGDRIFLELARHWQNKLDITIAGSVETQNLLNRYHLNIKFVCLDQDKHSLYTHHFIRIYKSFIYIFKNYNYFKNFDYLYSVSDFLPDSLPSFLIKLLFPNTIWIAGFYLFAPNPFSKSSPYNQNHQFFKGLAYFLVQQPSLFLIKLFSNIVFVTSKPDTYKFKQKTVIIRGGVPDEYLLTKKKTIKYQAIFIGRFHPQKGILLLIDIWKIVVKSIPNAKLAIIGNGDLLSELIQKIKANKLTKNITIFGFLDGQKKLNILSRSKIVVHPATYDSGGMAAAEAMSLGLPGVSFDLEALKSYYPKGMVKTRCFSNIEFAKNIIELLTNHLYYQQKSTEALNLIKNSWLWSKQAEKIYQNTF